MASNPWNSLPKQILESPEFQNNVKSLLAIVRLRDALVAPTERIMKKFVAAKITPGEACTKCTADKIKGAKGSRCPVCQPRMQFIMGQAGTHGGAKAQINWSNSDPRKWNTHYWEVAKCYLGPGQKDSSGPETTDCANIITLWLNCCKFTPLCAKRELLENVRVIRNKLMHSPDMKQSAYEMAAVFESIKELLNDEKLRINPDVDCQAVIADLESIRENTSVTFSELKGDLLDDLMKQSLRSELADTYLAHYSQLQPVPWADIQLPINIVYQQQTLRGREDEWRKHARNSELKDIFLPVCEGEARPKRILIEGAPGMGKTTLCQRLILDWALLVQPSQSESGAGTEPSSQEPATHLQPEPLAELQVFDTVVFLRVRDLTDGSLADNMRQHLLSSRWHDEERLVHCMGDRRHPVLIIIDGYDEGDERQKACVDGWLTGWEMRGATIIITSRPGFCHPDPTTDRKYTLEGFDESRQSKYIQQFDSLMGAETNMRSIQEQLTPFQGQDCLQFPLLLALVCFMARQGQGVLPKTTTGLYKYFVEFMCKKALTKPLHFQKEYVIKLQILLQHIASDLFAISNSEITENVLRKFVSEPDTTETMDNLCKLGLVYREIKIKGLTTFQSGAFIHQSFRDYFMALKYISLSKKERSKLLENTEIHQNVLVFVAGLCESGGHSECFTQMLSAWKRQVEMRVPLPSFSFLESDEVIHHMNAMYRPTCDHHSILHAPLLWLNQLTDPDWLSADNVADITQTTKGIHLTCQRCTASCRHGLLNLTKACRYLHPSLPCPASRTLHSPLQTLRQSFSRLLTSQTPLHLTLDFTCEEAHNSMYELLHHTLQSRDSVRCVRLNLPVWTRDACERLSDRLPDCKHLMELCMTLSSWESVEFVSRGFQPKSLLQKLTLICHPSFALDPPPVSSIAWSPSSYFLAAISRLHQLQVINLLDDESSLTSFNRRVIYEVLLDRFPNVELIITDWQFTE